MLLTLIDNKCPFVRNRINVAINLKELTGDMELVIIFNFREKSDHCQILNLLF